MNGRRSKMRRAQLGKKRAAKSAGQAHLRTVTRHEKHHTKSKHASASLGRRNAGFDGEKWKKNARTRGLRNPSGSAFLHKRVLPARRCFCPGEVSGRSLRGVQAKRKERPNRTPLGHVGEEILFPEHGPEASGSTGRFCSKHRVFHEVGSLFAQKRADTCH